MALGDGGIDESMPVVYVIGGANEAGKTTSALSILPSLGVIEYVNADAVTSALAKRVRCWAFSA